VNILSREAGCIDPVWLRRIVDGSRGALLPLAVMGPWGWRILAAVVAVVAAVGIYDLVQRKPSVLRNYPVLGHMRLRWRCCAPRYSSTSSNGTLTAVPSTAMSAR